MAKLPMKLKITTDYLKNLKHGNCTLKKYFYNAERYKLQKIIINKKEDFLETN